jgi:hypothetical protein
MLLPQHSQPIPSTTLHSHILHFVVDSQSEFNRTTHFKVTIMKRVLLSFAVAFVALATSIQAQESASTTRIGAQHKSSKTMEKQLPQYEANLLSILQGDNPTMQAQAVQTLRDLEQLFPQYPFASSLAPLASALRNDKTDGVVRRLAALALDELHSDAGDLVIKDIATECTDKGLQTLCSALMVKGQYK